jgi:tRNA 2-thiocytidine biosynthesis protein TtcA
MGLPAPPADPARADRLAHYLLKAVNKANFAYNLLQDGDSVLVAVSGGKDSLSLLDLLDRYRRIAPQRYTLKAGFVRYDRHCGRAAPEEWLQQWCADRGVPFFVEELAVQEELARTHLSPCFRCAWLRRKTLFLLAGRLGCNKLAFGHHADDIAETTLLNLFFAARLRPMEPRVVMFGGALTVIRPLALVEERDIVPFAQASGYPLAGEPCPQGLDSRRALVKRVLRELEGECHQVKRHIFRAAEHCQRLRALVARQGQDPFSGAAGTQEFSGDPAITGSPED